MKRKYPYYAKLLAFFFFIPLISFSYTGEESHHERDDQRLIAKYFSGNLNPQLGLDSPNTAACISVVCGNGAMDYLAWNAKSSGAWVGRFHNHSSLKDCIERVPIDTQNLIIGAHGCPDGCGPLNLSNYEPIAAAIKMKGIKHVALASCSVGANSTRRENNSLPKLLAKESGARVTSYSQPLLSGSNEFSAPPGTIATTWTPGGGENEADHLGVIEGDGSPNQKGSLYPDEMFDRHFDPHENNFEKPEYASKHKKHGGTHSSGGGGSGGGGGAYNSSRGSFSFNTPKMPSLREIPKMGDLGIISPQFESPFSFPNITDNYYAEKYLLINSDEFIKPIIEVQTKTYNFIKSMFEYNYNRGVSIIHQTVAEKFRGVSRKTSSGFLFGR